MIFGCIVALIDFIRPGDTGLNWVGGAGSGIIQPNSLPGPSRADSIISVSVPSR